MFRKSEQMGVLVLDVEGKIIVGYDPEAMEYALAAAKSARATPTQKAASKKKVPGRKRKK